VRRFAVTSLVTEHLGVPSRARGARALDSARKRADEQLRRLAQRLEAMLRGVAPALRPHPGEEEVYAEGMRGSEALVGEEVGPDDVVVLHDPLTAVLAQAIRERGAHAVLHVGIGPAPMEAGAGEAWSFMREYASPIDAYVTVWCEPVRRGPVVQRIGALIASADVVAAKEIEAWPVEPYQELAWSALLADVVHTDRDETVGGRFIHGRRWPPYPTLVDTPTPTATRSSGPSSRAKTGVGATSTRSTSDGPILSGRDSSSGAD
jgi:hypothetical protein